MVSAGRRLAAALAAAAMACAVLAGCGEARDVAQGVDKARDCAALVGELTGVDWGDVRRSAAEADQAARQLAATCDVPVDQVGG